MILHEPSSPRPAGQVKPRCGPTLLLAALVTALILSGSAQGQGGWGKGTIPPPGMRQRGVADMATQEMVPPPAKP